ncbi:hypothetical protein WJX81_008250 [Elliptochloris bilobata]|uniref:Uncharacterized protein n=1 Tax=Elliptochloris bilobata TaxID=381761 RepID=A0AAW1RCN7_9CHLO
MDALCSLLHTQFFHPCPTCATGSSAQRDTTVNHFNLDSLTAGCSHCLPASGSGQRVLQVRRSSYHDVLKVSDIARLMDTSGIQTYVINGAKVVFIKRRPQMRPSPKEQPPFASGRELDRARWPGVAHFGPCSLEAYAATAISRRKGFPHRAPFE